MIKPHAFVAMPFGKKAGRDGKEVDFKVVDREILPELSNEAQ